MKYLKVFETDYKDLVSDLSDVGASDWGGYFITYKADGDNESDASAIAIVGDTWKNFTQMILIYFGVISKEEDLEFVEIDLEDIKSIEDILSWIDDHYSSDLAGNWFKFEYKVIKMKPSTLKNSIETYSLLDFGKVLEMGRKHFSDFDSSVIGG
jgi:hypothetical protein